MRGRVKLTVGVLGAAALCACTVENNTSIAILFNGLAEGEDCVVSGETTLFLSQGTLDVSLGHGYFMAPIIENRMRETTESRNPTTGTEVQATAERNNILIRGVEVELRAIDCNEGDQACLAVAQVVDQNFFAPGAADVGPAETQPVFVSVIPAGVSRELLSRGLLRQASYVVRARIRAIGGRNADEEIKSGDFDYYITLCQGCLARGIEPPQACPGGEADGYCGRAQDRTLDCCVQSNILYCPASSAPTQSGT